MSRVNWQRVAAERLARIRELERRAERTVEYARRDFRDAIHATLIASLSHPQTIRCIDIACDYLRADMTGKVR